MGQEKMNYRGEMNTIDEQNISNVTNSPQEILLFQILQRRDYVIDAIESYYILRLKSTKPGDNVIRSRVQSLFLTLRGALLKDKGLNWCQEIDEIIKNRKKDIEEVIKKFNEIEEWLYQKEVTKFDTKKKWDSSRVEAEHKEKGM